MEENEENNPESGGKKSTPLLWMQLIDLFKIIKIIQVLAGLLCMVVGSIILVYDQLYNEHRSGLFTTGEGLWCGVWV